MPGIPFKSPEFLSDWSGLGHMPTPQSNHCGGGRGGWNILIVLGTLLGARGHGEGVNSMQARQGA